MRRIKPKDPAEAGKSKDNMKNKTNAKADYDRHRRTSSPALHRAKRIRSSVAWQQVRRSVLNRNPLCCDPLGQHAALKRIEPATQVHHILPLVTHPDLAFTRSNLAAICTGCHSQIEAQERAGRPTAHLFAQGQGGGATGSQGGRGGQISGTDRPQTERGGFEKIHGIFSGVGDVRIKNGEIIFK